MSISSPKRLDADLSVRNERSRQRESFVAGAGWPPERIAPLAADASTRAYYRIDDGARRAVLMDAPPGAESGACPPDADEAARQALGYNAVARLAGPDARVFGALSGWLNEKGLSAPKVLAADYDEGLLLLEDLGDKLFAAIIQDGADPRPLYEAAVDVLLELHKAPVPKEVPVERETRPLLAYDRLAKSAEIDLLLEWYLATLTHAELPHEARIAFHDTWHGAWNTLTPMAPVMVLRDYHAENLLWLEGRSGPARVGLLDFQDALAGHPAYDLVSLLTDARRDVEPDLAAAMLERYIAARKAEPGFDEAGFRTAYALLSVQRNAKILGIFARLWKRDGKPRYLSFIPRVWRYCEESLKRPGLEPLDEWFDHHIPPPLRGDAMAKLQELEANG